MVRIRRERGFTEIACILALSQIAFVGLGLDVGSVSGIFWRLSGSLLEGVRAVEVDTELPLVGSCQADLQHLGTHQLLVEQRQPVVLGGTKPHISTWVHRARYFTWCLMQCSLF